MDIEPTGERGPPIAHFSLKTAVNAKTPRGKGARDRKMTREKQVYITHPVGDSPQQPKPLRLCTFAVRWFNCFF